MRRAQLSGEFLEAYRQYIAEGGRKAGLSFPSFPGVEVDPCQNMNAKELCEEFVRWGTEVSTFLWDVYEDLYGGEPGNVDPPPPPPFKGG